MLFGKDIVKPDNEDGMVGFHVLSVLDSHAGDVGHPLLGSVTSVKEPTFVDPANSSHPGQPLGLPDPVPLHILLLSSHSLPPSLNSSSFQL